MPEQMYVCENCHNVRPLSKFNDDCKPGWTHGRLTKVADINTDGDTRQ